MNEWEHGQWLKNKRVTSVAHYFHARLCIMWATLQRMQRSHYAYTYHNRWNKCSVLKFIWTFRGPMEGTNSWQAFRDDWELRHHSSGHVGSGTQSNICKKKKKNDFKVEPWHHSCSIICSLSKWRRSLLKKIHAWHKIQGIWLVG